MKYSGISAVLAKSFARIFYRNDINMGMLVLICDTSAIKDSDWLQIDMDNGRVIISESAEIPCQALSPMMQSILSSGGLVKFLKEKGDYII